MKRRKNTYAKWLEELRQILIESGRPETISLKAGPRIRAAYDAGYPPRYIVYGED